MSDCYVEGMSRSLLEDGFRHHVWATLRLIDVCLELTPEQLGTSVPGTYGSILDTQRHLVGADANYLFVMTGGRTPLIDEDVLQLPELRTVMEEHGVAWSRLLAENPDPETVLTRHRDDGSETHAPLASGSRRRCTTAPTTAARSARPSRPSASNRRSSTSGTSASKTTASSRSHRRPDEPLDALELVEVLVRELGLGRAHVVLQVRHLRRPGDRQHHG